VFVILVLNIVAFLFMFGVNFSQSIFSAYLKSLGAVEIIISIGAAALYVTRGTTSILVNKISNKISFKKLFFITFIGSAISSILIGIPTNPLITASLRMLQGMFSGLYWVLINIYAANLGTKYISKFKNLSSVSIFLNLGGFLGSIMSARIASTYSPHLSFYIGFSILFLSSFITLFLKDIKNQIIKNDNISRSVFIPKQEKTIIRIALLGSFVFAFINIGVPLFVLKIGGSYTEIGYMTGYGILGAAIVLGISPKIKMKYTYKQIIRTDYILILLNLFLIFYTRNMYVIYISQAVLMSLVALERNLCFAVLQEVSKNFNKSVGVLRGYMDYLGALILVTYGLLIQLYGAQNIFVLVALQIFIILYVVVFSKKAKFLSRNKIVQLKNNYNYKNSINKSSL